MTEQAIEKVEPKAPAPSPVTLRAGGLMPDSMDGIWRLATAAAVAGVIPSAKTKEQAFILLAAGFEAGLGFTATCKNVMLVNNRPSLWGDAALALVVRSPVCKSIQETTEGTGDGLCAVCTIQRDGWPLPTVRRFGVADAKKAGLWNKAGPWTNYPSRMLQMRARAFALRDAFPDLLMGLGIVEEQDDIPVSVASSPTTPQDTPERVALPEVPETPETQDEPPPVTDAAAKAVDDALFLQSLSTPAGAKGGK